MREEEEEEEEEFNHHTEWPEGVRTCTSTASHQVGKRCLY
jgi:hypothetical protein